MRILFAIGYNLRNSPWATRPLSLVKELIKKGYDITLLGQESENPDSNIHSIPEGISYTEIPWRTKSIKIKIECQVACCIL